MTILFADLLGVRSRWHEGGRDLAEQAFRDFRGFVAKAINGLSDREVTGGGIETDSAAIVCASTDIALDTGRRLFRYAFEQSSGDRERRFWLRGAIVPYGGNGQLRSSEGLGPKTPQIQSVRFDDDLLEAIQVEKSGIKGMRLLVDERLCTPETVRRFRIQVGRKNIIPLKRLRNSSYPGKVATGYVDFFWMATGDEYELQRYERLMAQKLRHSAHKSEEFLQAAATQVLFHECIAIIGSVRTRLHFEAERLRARQNDGNLDAGSVPTFGLADGTTATVGDTLVDGTRELGTIVSIHPEFAYLSAPGDIHRKVRIDSALFGKLTKKTGEPEGPGYGSQARRVSKRGRG